MKHEAWDKPEEAEVVTFLRGIKEDAADKNTYIDISFTRHAAR